MLPEKIIYIGVLINLIAIFWYIKTILYGKTRPNLISWTLWALAPLIATFLQTKAGAGLSFLAPFMAGFGPLIVILFASIKKRGFWRITKFDIVCGLFSLLALTFYIITNKLAISIFFAILSDALATIPTIRKSWNFPDTESALAYAGGIINYILSLLIITNWIFSIYSFNVYLIIINLIIIFSIYRKKIFKIKHFLTNILKGV